MNSEWSFCPFCGENVDVDELTQLCNCNHIFCTGCLREYFCNYLAEKYHQLQEAKLPIKMDVLCQLHCPALACHNQIDHNQLFCTLLRRPAQKEKAISRKESRANAEIGLTVVAYGSSENRARSVTCSWTDTLEGLRRRVCQVLGSKWIANVSALHIRYVHVEYNDGILVEKKRTFQYIDLNVEENAQRPIKLTRIQPDNDLVFDRDGALTGKSGFFRNELIDTEVGKDVVELLVWVCEERRFRLHKSLSFAEDKSLGELLRKLRRWFRLDCSLEQMPVYLPIPPLYRELAASNASLDSLHDDDYQFVPLNKAQLNRSLKEVGIRAKGTVVVDLSGDIQLLLPQFADSQN